MFGFNFAIIGLAIGIGLLRFRPGWRWGAPLATWFSLANLLVAAGYMIFGSGHDLAAPHLELFGYTILGAYSVVFAFAFMTLFGALLIWVHVVLTRHELKQLFRQRSGFSRPWLEWVAVLAAVLLFLPPAALLEERRLRAEVVFTAADFGPVVERVLNTEGRHDSFLDLATGDSIESEAFLDPNEWANPDLWEWLRENPDVDLFATADREWTRLAGSFSTVFIPVPAGAWHYRRPLNEAATQLLLEGPDEWPESVMVWGWDDLPATYAFRTVGGSAGLLQILLATDEPIRAVRFRYKLLDWNLESSIMRDQLGRTTEFKPRTQRFPERPSYATASALSGK